MARLTTSYGRLRPLIQRDVAAAGGHYTTVQNTYITQSGGNVGDLSWVVPKSTLLRTVAPLQIDSAQVGDLSQDRTLSLNISGVGALGVESGALAVRVLGGGALSRGASGLAVNVAAAGGVEIDTNALRVRMPTDSGIRRDAAGLAVVPGNLSVLSTTGNSGATHTHEVIASPNPGAAASLLETDASGYLRLVRLIATDRLVAPTLATEAGDLMLAPLTGITRGVQIHAQGGGARVRTPLIDTETGPLQLSPANGVTQGNQFHATGTGARVRTPLLDSAASQDMTVAPGGDLYLSPVGVVGIVVPVAKNFRSNNYSPGIISIAGFRIGQTDLAGQSGLEIGTIRSDELHTTTFVADQTRIDDGQRIQGKSRGILAAAFTTPTSIGGTRTIVFEDSPAFEGALFDTATTAANGDWIEFRYVNRQPDGKYGAGFGRVFGQVYNYVDLTGDDEGNQQWTFVLRYGPVSKALKKGNVGVSWGKSGQGIIKESAIDQAGAPYILFGRWEGANPYTPANERNEVMIGNLNAMFAGQRGLWAGTGTTNADQFVRISQDGTELRNVPLRLFNGRALTAWLQQNGSLNLSSTDAATHQQSTLHFNSSTGLIRLGREIAGLTNLLWDGTNLRLRLYTTSMVQINGNGTMVLGEVAENLPNLYWDGSALRIRNYDQSIIVFPYTGTAYFANSVTVGASSNIQLIPGNPNTARVQVGTGETAAGINAISAVPTDISFWSGSTHANRTGAPFRVQGNGKLFSTDADLTGIIRWGNVGVADANGMRIAATSDWRVLRGVTFRVNDNNLMGVYGSGNGTTQSSLRLLAGYNPTALETSSATGAVAQSAVQILALSGGTAAGANPNAMVQLVATMPSSAQDTVLNIFATPTDRYFGMNARLELDGDALIDGSVRAANDAAVADGGRNLTMAAGWRRLGEFAALGGRGFARVSLWKSGGDGNPFHLIIDAFSTWNHTVGGGWITVEGSGQNLITAVRITSDGTIKYLEAFFAVSQKAVSWRQEFGSWSTMGPFSCYTTAVAGGGTSILQRDLNTSASLTVLGAVVQGNLGVGTTTPAHRVDVAGGGVVADYVAARNSYTPTSSSDPIGEPGQFVWDNTYFYIRLASSWRRIAHSSF